MGALIAALAIAGCGDSDSDSSGASAGGEGAVESGSLTKEEFLEQADKACAKLASEAKARYVKFAEEFYDPKGNQGQQATVLIKAVIPYFEDQIDEIESLGAPSGDEDEIEEILVSFQASVDQARAQPMSFISSEAPLGNTTKLASAYGFKACGIA
jgi:hypothetical protein